MCWAQLGFLSEKWQDEWMKRPFSLKICIKALASCITGPWNCALSREICAIFGDRSHFARRCSKVLLFCPAPKTNLMLSCTGLPSRPRFLFTITNPSENSLLIGLRYPLGFWNTMWCIGSWATWKQWEYAENMKHVSSACRMLDHVDTPIPRDVQIEFCDNWCEANSTFGELEPWCFFNLFFFAVMKIWTR